MECSVPRARKTKVGSVNSLHWDYKHAQEDTWKQLIIICARSLLMCVQDSSGTKCQVENDRQERRGLGRRASCGYVDRKFGTNISSRNISSCLPACLHMMSFANFNLILLKSHLFPKSLYKEVQYNSMCLDEGYELGCNDL